MQSTLGLSLFQVGRLKKKGLGTLIFLHICFIMEVVIWRNSYSVVWGFCFFLCVHVCSNFLVFLFCFVLSVTVPSVLHKIKSDCVCRRQICSPCCPGRLGARHHGLRAIWPLRPDFPSRQFCVWSVWCWQQLGQGTLHRGRRAG